MTRENGIPNQATLLAGTYVRLQPETSDFQKVAGDATEDILVNALSKRSALSEGDRLSVEIGDAIYWLRVQQLKPKPHVSVIGKSHLILRAPPIIFLLAFARQT